MHIAIPTGQRAERASQTIQLWAEQGINIIAYVWDDETFNKVESYCHSIYRGERKPFSILQNFMVATHPDWSAIICGADDLWPGENIDKLKEVVTEYDGKVLWIFDGLNPKGNTHPVITKKWYEKYVMEGKNYLFDEKYMHNRCDTDLTLRLLERKELIRVEGITFNHQHPMTTPIENRDSIYQLGYSFLKQDSNYFLKKNRNLLNTQRSVLKNILLHVPKVSI